MRIFTSWALALVVIAAAALSAQQKSDADTVRALEMKWTESYKQRDIEILSSLLADDFVITVEDGSVYSKAGYISHTADSKVRAQIKRLQESGYGHYPVCVAKTQYSFSTNPDSKGAPTGFSIPVREVRLSAGAEFIVAICGEIMTMPGLPKVPSADSINVDANGKIVGLF